LDAGRVGVNKRLGFCNFFASGWVGDINEPVDWELVGFALILAVAFENYFILAGFLF